MSEQRKSRTVSHPKCSAPRDVTCGAVYFKDAVFYLVAYVG